MKSLIQRTKNASVTINNKIYGKISFGIVALIAFSSLDNEESLLKMIDKIVKYRIFNDNLKKMNLSLLDVQGELLIVPQFTLMAETKKGLRPSFSKSCNPKIATLLFDKFLELSKKKYPNLKIENGIFGQDMQIHLINDGPATFLLEN